jgi:chromosome segregation protein
MLTALELYGFKSFADRTRFEFPAGITVIVGPNGSGKSNIVDAIKWVLGEQSARSMRGKEMADVIFKGTSGPGGRKPANTAEATLILDNRSRRLRLDADEIRLTRRVYRSGEGEYLINGEPCRLKDIRNLTRGTGIGADSYSLIEQGKVDQLLKASPRDRRAIFEEAAGISRFKAKKIEAERRLERVEQNLARLGDIVEEVGSRYRKVRAQATRAARYKELVARLQELRTHAGIKDWQDFTRHLSDVEGRKAGLVTELAEVQNEMDGLDGKARQLDVDLSARSARMAEIQQQINDVIQEIAQRQSNVLLNQSRVDDFIVQSGTARQGLDRDARRVDDALKLLEQSRGQLASAEKECGETASLLQSVTARLEKIQSNASVEREEANARRERLAAIAAVISVLGKELGAGESRLQMLQESGNKLEIQQQENRQKAAELNGQLEHHLDESQRLQNEAASKDSALAEARQKLEQVRQQLKDQRQKLDDQRRRQTGATQRAEVIQELENRLEGVDSGARDLIERSRKKGDSAFREVVGLVADIIKVNVQHAELVDIALGANAQALMVDGSELVAGLATGRIKPNGRVRIMQLPESSAPVQRNLDLLEKDGVVGRLDQLVQYEARWSTFVESLLGNTWLVKSLAVAIQLRQSGNERARFVTLAGELVDSDGTLVAGPRALSIGLVSRRSELRALHRDIHELSSTIRELAADTDRLSAERGDLESTVERLLGENTGIARQLSEHDANVRSIRSQLQGLEDRHSAGLVERDRLKAEIEATGSRIGADREKLLGNERETADLNAWLSAFVARSPETERTLIALQHEQTAHKVQLARMQQQQAEAARNLETLSAQVSEWKQNIASARCALAKVLWQQRSSRLEIADSSRMLSELQARREKLEQSQTEQNQLRGEVDRARRETAQQHSRLRDRHRKLTDEAHEVDLRERQLQMERQQLALRLREDYGIDITQANDISVDDAVDREAVNREIGELRAAIGNIGPVNMDALAELEEMQQRYELLESQFRDLTESREELGKIIQRINQDSRKLFSETLEAIRANFQVLFRQTFGGGRADLVIEEGVDILEAGVDIVATPPGKPEFSNSLLSGGERALTAVSLMMAVFQFRPSPFCVLDEVDAPFDEANIGRFIDVLRSFLTWTKFIIVTHSKRTMTAATTLYGVTMQESGVSKKVSVRFEDVSEDGAINSSPASDERTVA